MYISNQFTASTETGGQIDLVWGLAFPILERIYGYVPAKRFGLGKLK